MNLLVPGSEATMERNFWFWVYVVLQGTAAVMLIAVAIYMYDTYRLMRKQTGGNDDK